MLETILYHAWYGPLRRPLRPVLQRLTAGWRRIIAGPLRGQYFDGPETTCRLGIYELPVQQALRRLLRPGDVCYDLGANNGYLSLLAARCVGKDGCVYSFDPLPANVERIGGLMRANQIEQHETVAQAVADRTGVERLFCQSASDTYTASLIRQNRPGELPVRVTTLDEFINDHRRPDLVKMDVEGAELLVLQGASRLLTNALPWLTPRIWLIEVHTATLDREVTELMERYGYRVEPLDDQNGSGSGSRPAWRKAYPRHIIARRS